MGYLEERFPEPALLNGDLRVRATARLHVQRFDSALGDDYYAFRRGDDNELPRRLEELPVGESLYSDFAYLPWVIRARDMLGLELPARLASWLDRLSERPSVAAEVDVVRSLSAELGLVLLVGHNPGMEELVVFLAGVEATEVRPPTAGLAHVEIAVERWADVERGSGRLVALFTPKGLGT